MNTLRAKRIEKGLTLRDVGKATGIALGYISDIERGNRRSGNISLRYARALSAALDTPIIQLFPPSDSEQPETNGRDQLMMFRCPECKTEFLRRRSTMPDDDLWCPNCPYNDEARNFDGDWYERREAAR